MCEINVATRHKYSSPSDGHAISYRGFIEPEPERDQIRYAIGQAINIWRAEGSLVSIITLRDEATFLQLSKYRTHSRKLGSPPTRRDCKLVLSGDAAPRLAPFPRKTESVNGSRLSKSCRELAASEAGEGRSTGHGAKATNVAGSSSCDAAGSFAARAGACSYRRRC